MLNCLIILNAIFNNCLVANKDLKTLCRPTRLIVVTNTKVKSFVINGGNGTVGNALGTLPLLFHHSGCAGTVCVSLLTLLCQLVTGSQRVKVFSLRHSVRGPHRDRVFTDCPHVLTSDIVLSFVISCLHLVVDNRVGAFRVRTLVSRRVRARRDRTRIPTGDLTLIKSSLPTFNVITTMVKIIRTLNSTSHPTTRLNTLVTRTVIKAFLNVLLTCKFVSPLTDILHRGDTRADGVVRYIGIALLSGLGNCTPPVTIRFNHGALCSDRHPSFVRLRRRIHTIGGPRRRAAARRT